LEAGQLGGGPLSLRCWELGQGEPVLFLHESATTGEVWRPLAELLSPGMRAISYDRRGWGGSPAPDTYTRTTVEEQAEDAASLLDERDVSRAMLCGAGLGAVAALDLLMRRPRLVAAAVLIEPPLLAFLPDATEGLSSDRAEIEAAVQRGGPAEAVDLYLDGGLPFLGPGAGRIPDELAAAARERPLSLFAELAAVPGWPLRTPELIEAGAPSVIVLAASTPPVLRLAGEALAARLGESRLLRVGGEGLPAIGAASGIAAAVESLREG
jgi:pimeloyl-ACP methyl ester carboxylesterase